jgi:isoquinoline 1-oxidoreductase beta subunit
MARIAKIARRTFLVGSAAVAGGVAFGYYLYRKPIPNPLLGSLTEGQAALTPFVQIDRDGITLITPHADLGQGARSMQAMLIAEELDLDLGQFQTSPGQPSAAYFNTAIAADLAPFLSTDEGRTATAVRGLMGAGVKILGLQITGGSSSSPDSFDKLRMAGAVARETLKAAAAQVSGLPLADLKTGGGAVLLPDGTSIPYVDLAAVAATLPLAENVTLRDPGQWRLIGKPVERLDIVAKSTGTLTYGIDLAIDGMIHATIRTNPRRGAMLGFDASAAETMKGVLGIVPLANGAAVLADNTWRAFQAADAITFDWGPAPYPAEMDAHWAEVAASFTDDRLDGTWRKDGDTDAALGAAAPITAEYRAPYAAHQPLEPLSAIVRVSADCVDVWVAHQMPRFVQEKVAAVTGHDTEQVFVHNQYAGGSFGHRLEFDWVVQTAAIAATRPDTPIKMTLRREEDFAQDYPRQITMARGQGAVRDGQVDVYDLQIASVSASTSQADRLGQPMPGADGQIPAGAWNLPFAVPHCRVRAYRVPPLAPVSSWRSVGAATAGFFADSFLDELIHAAGADPMAERLRLANTDIARKVLEAVAEMSDWGSPMPAGRGRGVAFVESFGVPVAEVVEVTAAAEGIRIDRVFVAADVGRVIDPVTFANQVQGGVVWGLGHAMNCEITYADGMAEQVNFDQHTGMRLYQCPEIVVRGLENGPHVRGIGEPPVPPAAPALANAIFAATGQRLREMPFAKFVDFV